MGVCDLFIDLKDALIAMRKIRLILLLVLAVSITACAGAQSTPLSVQVATDEVVDPRFREFYDLLGGRDVLGIPISPMFSQNGLYYQYTAAALMVYDTSAVAGFEYDLAPIGVEMGVAEAPRDPSAPNGHAIFSGFSEMYQQLGGTRYVGLPLTDVRFNTERGGVEQYFENLGFYQLETDPPNLVRLIEYGAWMCAASCAYDALPNAAPLLPSVVVTPFASAVSRLNPVFTGRPLSEPYISLDGQLEQIFENVVIVSDANKPGGIDMRPITAMLGVSVDLSTTFDVPEHFLDFLRQNSGLELSGPAVTAYSRQSDEVYRQCFRNLCLDFFPNKPAELRVRPTSLGYLYKSRYYQEGDLTDAGVSSSNHTVTLKVSEGYGLVAPGDSQIFSVTVYENNQPLVGVSPTLALMLPGGEIRSYTFAETRADGFSSLSVDPVSTAHGTRVDYRICVMSVGGDEVCVDGDYLIWGSPY